MPILRFNNCLDADGKDSSLVRCSTFADTVCLRI